MEEQQEQKGIFEILSPQQTFIVGIVGGVLGLCTIGFFMLLSLMFKGDISISGTDDKSSVTVVTTDSGKPTNIVEGPPTFSACLDSGKYAQTVAQDQQLGGSLGVNGTPSTFINGYNISGALPFVVLKDVIDDLLAGKKVFIDDFALYGMESGTPTKVTMPELPNVAWRGNEQASVSIVEFSDFECPYCNKFEPTIKQVLDTYGDKVRFTYRHFPLSFHPNAEKAAEAYECAKEQGKGFEMHDKLFDLARSSSLGTAGYANAATELGLN